MDVLKLMEEKAFWGAEFLTWLWYLSENSGGEIEVEGHGPVALWIEEHLVLEGPDSQSHENIIKSGDVAGSAEAAAALSVGKKVSRARFGLAQGEMQWSFTLDGASFDMRSMKIPKVEAEDEDADDPAAMVFLRMSMVRRCLDIIDALFTRFASYRVSPEWEGATADAMRRWTAEKTGN